MATKHQPTEIRKEQFFRSALELMAEKGYSGTRMEDIASRAGLSKGSLYHHFESKEQLFLESIENLFEQMKIELERDRQTINSAREAIMRMMDVALSYLGKDLAVLRGMSQFLLLSLRKTEFRARFAETYEEAMPEIAGLVRWGIELGEFDAELDVEQATRLLMWAGDGLMIVYTAFDRSVEELRDDVLALTERLLSSFEPKAQ